MLRPEEIVDLSTFLRRNGLNPSLHQIFAAQQLISQVQPRPETASGLVSLTTRFGPIFCCTPQEQEQFNALYLQWLRQRSKRPPTIASRAEPQKPTSEPPRYHWRMKLALVSLLLLPTITSWFLWQDFRERVVTGRVVGEGISLEKVTATFGEQPVLLTSVGTFTIPFQAKDMPKILAVEAKGFLPHQRDVGQGIKSQRNWLYLYPIDWSNELNIPDVVLKKDTPFPSHSQIVKPPKIQPPSLSLSREPLAVLRTPAPSWWDVLDLYKASAALLPLLTVLLWMLTRAWRQPVLKRLSSHIPPALKGIWVQAGSQRVFPSLSLRHITQRLRQTRLVPSTELDLARTIRQTVERAGLFTPMFGSKQEPGYVALIDRSTIGDHQANLATQLVSDLDRGYVLIRQYEFDDQATLLRQVEVGKTHGRRHVGRVSATTVVDVMTLEEVQAKFPTHRLLCFADAALCFDPLTGDLHPWMETLEKWTERFFFNTETGRKWGQAEWILARHGFHVIPLSSLGLRLFSNLIEQGNAPVAPRTAGAVRSLRLSDRMPERWLERHPPSPEIISRLMKELEQDLGNDGVLWMAACAAYPEIHWGLTLEWGVRLFGHGATTESLLPKLTPLIWFRQAFMPDWFRSALYDRLTVKDAEQISEGLTEILSAVNPETGAGLQLRIATKVDHTISKTEGINRLKAWFLTHRRRTRLQNMGQAAEPGHPMRDYVMLQYLSGGQGKALSPVAPRVLLHLLFPKGQPWLGFRPVLVVMMAVALSGAVWWWFAPDAVPVLAPIQATAISPDGTRVAVGRENGRLQVWDVATRRIVKDHAGGQGAITSLAMARRDGGLITTGYQNGSIQMWDVETEEQLSFSEHHTPVISLAFWQNKGGFHRLISISQEGAVVLTDIENNKTDEFRLLNVRMIAISRDGKWGAAGNSKGTVWMGPVSDQNFKSLLTLDGAFSLLEMHANGVINLAWDPTGRFLLTHDTDGIVRIWNKETGNQIAQLTVPIAEASTLVWPKAQEALMVSSGADGPEVWGVQIPEELLNQASAIRAPQQQELVEPVPRKITGKDGAPMVLVPAGEFMMGARDHDKQAGDDERPAHRVYLDAFYIDQFEVTTSLYGTFFTTTKRDPPRYWSEAVPKKHPQKPVVDVTWNDAEAYCAWAGKRLPTEAEWEKAARGTDQRLYPWGDKPPSKLLANFDNCCDFRDYDVLSAVGSFEDGQSPFGAYDMAGNVWEWVADWYDKDLYKARANPKTPVVTTNPSGPSQGDFRVRRGGSWGDGARDLRSSFRYGINQAITDVGSVGFRCAGDAEDFQLERLLALFQQAFENKDLLTIQSMTTMGSQRARFIKALFENYQIIEASTEIQSVTGQTATATIVISKLIDQKGQSVEPSPIIKETNIRILKEGNEWGKIQW